MEEALEPQDLQLVPGGEELRSLEVTPSSAEHISTIYKYITYSLLMFDLCMMLYMYTYIYIYMYCMLILCLVYFTSVSYHCWHGPNSEHARCRQIHSAYDAADQTHDIVMGSPQSVFEYCMSVGKVLD